MDQGQAVDVSTTSPSEWQYAQEGGANLVLSYRGGGADLTGYALRLRKRTRERSTPATSRRVDPEDWGQSVVRPLLGGDQLYLQPRVARLDPEWLEQVSQMLHSQRARPPEREQEDEIDPTARTAVLVKDLIAGQGILSIELKVRALPVSISLFFLRMLKREPWTAEMGVPAEFDAPLVDDGTDQSHLLPHLHASRLQTAPQERQGQGGRRGGRKRILSARSVQPRCSAGGARGATTLDDLERVRRRSQQLAVLPRWQIGQTRRGRSSCSWRASGGGSALHNPAGRLTSLSFVLHDTNSSQSSLNSKLASLAPVTTDDDPCEEGLIATLVPILLSSPVLPRLAASQASLDPLDIEGLAQRILIETGLDLYAGEDGKDDGVELEKQLGGQPDVQEWREWLERWQQQQQTEPPPDLASNPEQQHDDAGAEARRVPITLRDQVLAYLLSATFKDCSVFIRLSGLATSPPPPPPKATTTTSFSATAQPHQPQRHAEDDDEPLATTTAALSPLEVEIKVIDLDPKPLARLGRYARMDRDLVEHWRRNVVGGERGGGTGSEEPRKCRDADT